MKKKTTSKVTASEVIPTISSEVTSSDKCTDCKCKRINRLTGLSGSEDFNKLVEKINEIIDNNNDSI